jgi:hypothetical protein
MRKVAWGLRKFFLLILASISLTSPVKEQPFRDLLVGDLLFIKQTLIENHPGFYNEQDPDFREILYTNYDKAIEQSNAVISYDDYLRIMQCYVKNFNDTHLFLNIKDLHKKHAFIHKKQLPSIKAEAINEDIMWVTLPTFEPTKEQEQQLEEIIKQASSWQEQKNLVFDVRGNGGGNSVWANRIIKSLFSFEYAAEKIDALTSKIVVDWRCSKDNVERIKSYISSFENQFGQASEEYKWVEQLYFQLLDAYQKGSRYFSEKSQIKKESKKDPINPVKANIMVIIDGYCASACLDFIDYLKAMDHPITLIGHQTKGDSVYMEVRDVELPSGLGYLYFPMKVYRNRIRDNKKPYLPDIRYDGDIIDTQILKKFINLLIKTTGISCL